MKKIVSESIYEFKQNKINEGFFSKAIGSIKKFIQKIGQYFIFTNEEGEAEPVILPVNTGIAVKNGNLPDFISYVASSQDLSLEPGLSSENGNKLIQKYKSMEGEAQVNEAQVPLEHPNKNMQNVNRDSLFKFIRIALNNPKSTPLMIWGAPGIGKTEIVGQMIKALEKGRLVDVQTSKMAPDDWSLPVISKNEKGEVFAIDLPKTWLPVYRPSGDAAKDKKAEEALGSGVIFLDELSRANESVQNTCLKLVNERVIGDAKIGENWVIIAASNRVMDDPDTLPQWSSALGNRFRQINYVPKYEDWKEWAVGKVDDRILDFLEFNQDLFYTLDDENLDSAFGSPRSWADASSIVKDLEEDSKKYGDRLTTRDIQEAVASAVGLNIAQQVGVFFRLLESFKKEDIKKVFTAPDKAPLPKKAGSGYDLGEASAFLSIVVSSTKNQQELSPEEFTNFCKYLAKLDNASLATNALKRMTYIHPKIHEELGEVEGRDKYKEGIDLFIEKYKDIF